MADGRSASEGWAVGPQTSALAHLPPASCQPSSRARQPIIAPPTYCLHHAPARRSPVRGVVPPPLRRYPPTHACGCKGRQWRPASTTRRRLGGAKPACRGRGRDISCPGLRQARRWRGGGNSPLCPWSRRWASAGSRRPERNLHRCTRSHAPPVACHSHARRWRARAMLRRFLGPIPHPSCYPPPTKVRAASRPYARLPWACARRPPARPRAPLASAHTSCGFRVPKALMCRRHGGPVCSSSGGGWL